MHLRRTDRAEEGDDVRLRGELGEGEHRAGVGRLVVFLDDLDLLAHDAAGLVDPLQRQLRADGGVFAGLGRRSGDRNDHADLDGRPLRVRAAQDRGHGYARGKSRREMTPCEIHPDLPISLCGPCRD